MFSLWRMSVVASAAALATAPIATPVSAEPTVSHSAGLASKKGGPPSADPLSPANSASPLLATLVQTHSDERVPLDADSPTNARFSALLSDRVTGSTQTLDPRLLELLRSLAKDRAPARIELVSGYRSPKLNEMLRKKGHHVASHSQHSLGHAVDFRLIAPGETDPIDPRQIEQSIRALGWEGGVGVYVGKDDRFVHADVGPNRRWDGQ
jgi:uncharacterized protein YcbK (DUF882 family)